MRAEHGASFSILFAVTLTLLSLVTDLGVRLMFRMAIGLIEMTKAAPPMIAAPGIIATASPAAHTAAPMAMPGSGMFGVEPLRRIPGAIPPTAFASVPRLHGDVSTLTAHGLLGLRSRECMLTVADAPLPAEHAPLAEPTRMCALARLSSLGHRTGSMGTPQKKVERGGTATGASPAVVILMSRTTDATRREACRA